MADSLHYLSIEKMLDVFGDDKENFCSACFDGNYPVPIDTQAPRIEQIPLFTGD